MIFGGSSLAYCSAVLSQPRLRDIAPATNKGAVRVCYLEKPAATTMPPRKQTENTEEAVSMAQVRELLEQQKDFYKALLEQQEKSFKSCVEIMVDSSNKKVGELMSQVLDLRASLEFTQKEFQDFKDHCKTWEKAYKETKNNVESVSKSLIPLNENLDYMESQSRRNNVIIDGIKESEGEKWSDSEDKVKKLLSEKLELDPCKMEIERAHRIGKPSPSSTRPRPIVVKFLRFKDRVEVLNKAKVLKGTNIYINEDYPEAVRLKRKELLPAMRAAREKGEIAYLRYDKLIVHPPSQKLPLKSN